MRIGLRGRLAACYRSFMRTTFQNLFCWKIMKMTTSALLMVFSLLQAVTSSCTQRAEKIPQIVEQIMEERRKSATIQVERDFSAKKSETERFEDFILAVNRGVLANRVTTINDIEKMFGRKLTKLDKKHPCISCEDVRFIHWNIKYSDYSDFNIRAEKTTHWSGWDSYFAFDRDGKLLKSWIE